MEVDINSLVDQSREYFFYRGADKECRNEAGHSLKVPREILNQTA